MKMNHWQIGLLWGGSVWAAGAVAVTVLWLRQKKKNALLRQNAIADFSAKASSFIGLYEPLWMIREGHLKIYAGVFEDFNVRINNLEDFPALVQFWNENFSGIENWSGNKPNKKATELLDFVNEAGVSRGEETEVTVERDTFRQYNVKDGIPIERGTAATVETPYWSRGNDVLEKGIIKEKGGKDNV